MLKLDRDEKHLGPLWEVMVKDRQNWSSLLRPYGSFDVRFLVNKM